VWTRVATAQDAGQPVTVGFAGQYKGTVEVVAYAGTSAAGPVATFGAAALHTTTSSASTPQVTVATPGAWVVSYWAAKSSIVNAWTVPVGEVQRNVANAIGTGRINSVVADSGGPVPTGPSGGLVATTDQNFSAATTWTIVLAPGP